MNKSSTGVKRVTIGELRSVTVSFHHNIFSKPPLFPAPLFQFTVKIRILVHDP